MKDIPQYIWYDANFDPEILEARMQADMLCHQINLLAPNLLQEREQLLHQIFKGTLKDVTVLGPVYTDYCQYTYIGDGTFINHGAYFMDGGTIHIGSNCYIGPFFHVYTADHPLQAEERNQGLEIAKPVVVEDNVWISGDVTVLGGVTIGSGSVIGAGSLVRKDIPSGVMAAGNPCRVIRALGPSDSIDKTKSRQAE